MPVLALYSDSSVNSTNACVVESAQLGGKFCEIQWGFFMRIFTESFEWSFRVGSRVSFAFAYNLIWIIFYLNFGYLNFNLNNFCVSLSYTWYLRSDEIFFNLFGTVLIQLFLHLLDIIWSLTIHKYYSSISHLRFPYIKSEIFTINDPNSTKRHQWTAR